MGVVSHSVGGFSGFVCAEHVGVQSCCLGGLLGLVQDKEHGHSHTTRLAQAQGLQVGHNIMITFTQRARSRGNVSHQDMGWQG